MTRTFSIRGVLLSILMSCALMQPHTTEPENGNRPAITALGVYKEPPVAVTPTLIEDHKHDKVYELTTEGFLVYNPFGSNVRNNSASVLSSPETQEFLSNFSNPLKIRVIKQQLQLCPYQPLCSFTWLPVNDFYWMCCKGCSCTPDCLETMSCCPDIIPDHHYNISYKPPYMQQCTPNAFKPSSKGMLTYATCPEDTDRGLIENCTRGYEKGNLKVRDVVPVSDENKVIYRNIYCATCSHNKPKNLTFWFPELGCTANAYFPIKSRDTILQTVGQTDGCNIKYLPPILGIEKECKLYTSSCNVTGLWREYDPVLEWACSLYKAPVKLALHGYFKNVFCMLCNGHDKVATICYESDTSVHGGTFSFSALLNVREFEAHNTNVPGDCSPDTVWTGNQCFAGHCSTMRTLSASQCNRIIDKMSGTSYKVYVRVVPVDRTSTKAAFYIAYDIVNVVENAISRSTDLAVRPDTTRCLLHTDLPFFLNITASDLRNSSLIYYDIEMTFTVNSNHDPEIMLSNIMNEERTIQHVYDGHGGDTEEMRFKFNLKDDTGELFAQLDDVNPDIPDIFSITDDIGLDGLRGTFDINNENDTTILPFVFRIYMYEHRPGEPTSKIMVNFLSMRSCVMVSMSRQSYAWEESLYGLHFRHGVALNFSQFTYVNGSTDLISVCLESYLKIEQSLSSTDEEAEWQFSAEAIVSLLCVSLSIICLSVSLLTFCCLPAFATLPWKNNFALALSLLLAQLFYMVGSYGRLIKQSAVCISVGIGIHFFLLMFIIWMHICMVYMFRVLMRNRQMSKRAKWRKYCIYVAYSVLLCTVFVAGNIAYSVRNSSNVGYGNTICYINSQKMVLVTFGLPLAVVVVSNLIMLFLVMRKIRKTSAIQKKVKNETNLMIIIAKLSVITGLTWVFGLVYMFTDVAALSYIFIILNGSQGVFLMISFLCNTRVLTMYKTRFSSLTSSTN